MATDLKSELDDRGWSIREFGRRLDISYAHANRVVNRGADPRPELCKRMADVLKISVEKVYRLVGFLPEKPDEDDEVFAEIQQIYSRLLSINQMQLLQLARGLEEMQNNEEWIEEFLDRYEPVLRKMGFTRNQASAIMSLDHAQEMLEEWQK